MSQRRELRKKWRICIDCNLGLAETYQRCNQCNARNNRIARERARLKSNTPKAIFARTRIKSYTTLIERGLLTPKRRKNGIPD